MAYGPPRLQAAGDPGQLAGERDHDLVLVGSSDEAAQPLAHRGRARRERRQGRSGAMDQERAQVGVASLRDAEKPRLAAGRRLTGTSPSQAARSRARRKVSPVPIAATSAVALRAPKPGMVARRRAAWSSRARATNSAVSAAMRRSSSHHSRRMSSIRRRVRGLRVAGGSASVVEHRHEQLLEPPPSLRDHDAALQEHGAELVDQGRALADQAGPGTMQDLRVELRLALQLDEAHGRPRRGLRDRLGIPLVVLLRLDVGLHVLGRHQPHLVTLLAQDAAEVMSAAAGLHRHHAGRQLPASRTTPSRVSRRRRTTRPVSSSPATLQLFLPRSIPSTAIVIVRSSPSGPSGSVAPTEQEGRAIP